MMPRFARLVIPGLPHHVTQRGNRRQTVFHDDLEREIYLDLLSRNSKRYRLEIIGYSLMTNHTHNVSIPLTMTSLAKGFGRSHNDFSRWQNIRKNNVGHVWQNRYFSCPLDEDHFWKALRYIELNPVRAGIVKHAWDWPWSSARSHIKGFDSTGLLNMDVWNARFDAKRWREFLEEGLEETDEQDKIRLATRTGRPLGTEEFIENLEELTGRRLRKQKPGRKPKR